VTEVSNSWKANKHTVCKYACVVDEAEVEKEMESINVLINKSV